MLFESFKQGINLGGFLSQYELIADAGSEESLHNHFETFITEDDIRRIASWGFDHVRIPMDGYLFYNSEKKNLNTEPLEYLDRCVEWCAVHGVNAVIDLHNIKGHIFGEMDRPTPLMTEAELRDDFCRFWGKMADHFKDCHKIELMFELFNEITDSTGYMWNKLYKQAVEEIHKADPERWILVGTNFVNSVGYLDRLDLLEEPYVFYNFHYYEPNVFTHQKAHFSEEFRTWNQTLAYPGDMTDYITFLDTHKEFKKEHPLMSKDTVCNDKKLMQKLLSDAEKFMEYSGCELYCGEFGVIDSAPEEEAVKWIRDFITICNRLKIGHAMWNYKCLDFELVDMNNQVVRPEVLEVLKELNSLAVKK